MTSKDQIPGADFSTESAIYTETVVEYKDNRRMRLILAGVLAVLILLLIAVATSVLFLTRGEGAPGKKDLPKDVDWVRSIYGWGRTPETSLQSPTDAAFGPDGTIWVVSGGRTIAGFNPDGSLRKLIQPKFGKGEGQVHTLEGIEVSEDGTIYVTDEGKNKVIEFTQDGKWLGEWGIQFPIEIAAQGNKRLAVTGLGGVVLVTPKPELITKWGKRGKAIDAFDLPHGVAFGQDGTVFVSDTQNQRVSAFTQKGKRLWTTGVARTTLSQADQAAGKRGQFQLPAGITVDGNGRVVLVDAFAFKIQVLDPKTGKILKSYGDYGEADGWFAYPTGIDYDAERDWFAVADTANNRVQLIRLPDTGGSAFSGVRRLFVRPLWVFCLPLFLLLLVAIALMWRRRRQRELSAQTQM